MVADSPAMHFPFAVGVIGAGMAGLTTATRLAQLGHRVVVVESRRVLGGRASSWIDNRGGTVVDNGPHLFAGAYHQVMVFLRRVDALERVPLSRPLHVPLWSAGPPHRTALSVPPGTGRLGSAIALARFDALSWRERLGLLRVLRAAAAGEPSPDLPLAEWLGQWGQRSRSRRWFWNPLARAVFSDDPAAVSAGLFAEVLRRLFLESTRSSSLAHADRGLSDTYAEPAARYVARHGGQILRGRAAKTVRVVAGGYEILLGGETPPLPCRGLCLAVPAAAAVPLLPAGLRASCPGLEAASAVPSAPIVSVNLWLRDDTPLLGEPFIGLVDGGFSWYFDRSALTRDAGADRHITLVAPGARRLLSLPASEITDLAIATLESHAAPGLRERLKEVRVVKEPHAAPSLTPEAEHRRPSQETTEPGLVLAGDWTATGLPATLESAAVSGHRAAELLHAFLLRGA